MLQEVNVYSNTYGVRKKANVYDFIVAMKHKVMC